MCIIGGPYVMLQGLRLDIPEGSKRLLVFVALRGGRVDRRHTAATLWPNSDEERAAGNLRSALWRLKGAGISVLSADKSTLTLLPGTEVDVISLCEWAARLIAGKAQPADLECPPSPEAFDLLPGWYDDWVIFERERVRQRLLHALEALSRHHVHSCRWAEAVEIAMTAVSIEPLRESAQRVLVEAHLAERNVTEARRCIRRYRSLVRAELGVEPSAEFLAMAREDATTNRTGRPADPRPPSFG